MTGLLSWFKHPLKQHSNTRTRRRLELELLEDRTVPAGVLADYEVTTAWGSGFQAGIELTNQQTASVVNWRLEFDYAANITSIWNASIISRNGSHYIIGGAAWNGTIGAGGSVEFGFIGAGSSAAPSNYLLNGKPLDDTPLPPPLPTLSIGNASVTEGNTGNTNANFTVTLSAPAASPVTVTYSTLPGTATAGGDYLASSGTLTFAPGELTKTVSVAVVGDTQFEADETFQVQLGAPSGATLAEAVGTGTIRNDDAPPPPPSTGDVTFQRTSDWGSGFQGEITVRNSGTTTLQNWVLEFDYGGRIESIWNARIVSKTGNHYVVQGAEWNANIAAGGAAVFGFVASPGTAPANPTNFLLRGATPVNRVPVAWDDFATTSTNTPITVNVLANDTDADGNALSVTAVTQGQHGAVVRNANGSLTYTPAAGYTGTDSFRYTLSDGQGGTTTGAVSITVVGSQASSWPAQVFAPYVDMTLYPMYDLAKAAREQGLRHFTLAFIVADSQHRPSWGGFDVYAVGSGEFDTNVKSQLAAIRALGGDVIVSFGGAANHELAQVITDVTALRNAYQQVIDTYQLTRIDFDIEGAAAADRASIDRRSQAIAGLQQSAAAAGRELAVWFTLPVLPTGLTPDGVYVLQSALRYGVTIGGVNIMAMDYGDSAAPNPHGRMGDYAIQAATSLQVQLATLYGSAKTQAQLWQMVGVTPMIGLNDVTTEVFDQQEARELVAFAEQKGIGLLSMWSLNRDRQNPSGRIGYVDLTSSSLLQQPFEFSHIFDDIVG
ncbi:MAG: cellulose binding domain-containing protein [Planctomycetia bacterium]|nr:cellulose binding domain-containing protein [Planctomycetia bacterium]